MQRLKHPLYFAPDAGSVFGEAQPGGFFHISVVSAVAAASWMAGVPTGWGPGSLLRREAWAFTVWPRGGLSTVAALLGRALQGTWQSCWPSETPDATSATSCWLSKWLRPVQTLGRSGARLRFSRKEKQRFACISTPLWSPSCVFGPQVSVGRDTGAVKPYRTWGQELKVASAGRWGQGGVSASGGGAGMGEGCGQSRDTRQPSLQLAPKPLRPGSLLPTPLALRLQLAMACLLLHPLPEFPPNRFIFSASVYSSGAWKVPGLW